MPSMKGKTLLKGHALVNEGRLFSGDRAGAGYCECGENSGPLPNTSQRQKWHKAHKEAIRSTAHTPTQGDDKH